MLNPNNKMNPCNKRLICGICTTCHFSVSIMELNVYDMMSLRGDHLFSKLSDLLTSVSSHFIVNYGRQL